MYIERIELQNIKSYGSAPTIIEFGPGVNLIAGMNGAGKSTILEAIGFALFDSLPYNQKEFVRRGKSGSSRIVVRIRSSFDDRLYDIERTINPSNYTIYDVEENFKENLESKTEALEWLKQHLKVEQTADLESLFNNAIGMQQGTITSVFLDTPRNRKSTFDALLRVQDYRDAFDNLLETRNYIRDLIQKNNEEIARKEGQTERLPVLEENAKQIQDEIEITKNQLHETSKHLEEITTILGGLQQQKDALATIERELETQQTNINTLEARLKSAQENYEQSATAKEIVDTNKEAHTLYTEAMELLERLEQQRSVRDALEKERAEIKERLNAAQQHLEQIKESLETALKAEDTLKVLEPQVQQQEQLEKEQQGLLETQKERDRLQKQAIDDQNKLEELNSELEILRENVQERQSLGAEIEEQSQTKQTLTMQMEELEAQRHDLVTALQAADEALSSAEENTKQYEVFQTELEQKQSAITTKEKEMVEILAAVKQRETLEAELQALNEQITQTKSEQQRAQDTLGRIEIEMSELEQLREMVAEEGAVCPVCRREMAGEVHQEALVYYESQEHALKTEDEQAQTIVEDKRTLLLTLETEKETKESALTGLANQVVLKRIEDELDTISTEIEKLNSQLEQYIDAPQQDMDARTQQQEAQNALTQHDELAGQLREQREAITEKIAELSGQVSKLSSQDELNRRQEEQENLITKIEENIQQQEQYKDVDATLSRVADDLAALNNPREQYAIAQNEAQKRSGLEEEQTQQKALRDTAKTELTAQDQQLQAYASLDIDISQYQTQRKNHEEGHNRFVENKQLANQFTEREQELKTAQDALETGRKQYEITKQDYNQLNEEFDQEQYDTINEEKQSGEIRQAELKKDIEHHEEELEKAQEEIDKLQGILAQLQELQARYKELEHHQNTFTFVRNTIRDAGPRIRERKVRLVSEVASSYFNEIINDYTMRLEWDADDYGINIEQNGEVRPFQVLSGGEQMIAALSVRLALLTHMTRIRLIFLDEPTINLDDNRRVMLAEQLSKIHDLQQLFVISHDDTFVEGSNHVIRIEKEGNLSKVK